MKLARLLAGMACALAVIGCRPETKKREPSIYDEPPAPVRFEPVEGADAGAAEAPEGGRAAPRPPPQRVAPGRHVGDRISVRWKGTCYAARVVSVAAPGTYFITYEGYSHSWDETVGESRICH